MLDIHAEVDKMCDPPCEKGTCATNNTCNCFAGYQGERCTEEGRDVLRRVGYATGLSTSSFKHQDAPPSFPLLAVCKRWKARRGLGTRLDIILSRIVMNS